MLKLNYTETGFYLERLEQSLENWIAQRVILAVRVATQLCVEPSTASFLLPASLPCVTDFKILLEQESEQANRVNAPGDAIAIAICDAEYIEISLQGSWLSATVESEEGVFVTTMSEHIECFLFRLWQDAQPCTSSLR